MTEMEFCGGNDPATISNACTIIGDMADDSDSSPCEIFLSYSREDEGLIDPLLTLLKVSGRRFFRDLDSIAPGVLWENEISNAINECRTFIVFWCCHSAHSEWVGREIHEVLQRSASKSKKTAKRFIPVLFCDAQMPAVISGYQWVDLRPLIKHRCNKHGLEPPLSKLFERPSALSNAYEFTEKISSPSKLKTLTPESVAKKWKKKVQQDSGRNCSEGGLIFAIAAIQALPSPWNTVLTIAALLVFFGVYYYSKRAMDAHIKKSNPSLSTEPERHHAALALMSLIEDGGSAEEYFKCDKLPN